MKPKHAVFCLFVLAFTTVASAGKPNIIVIMADDLGWKDLHCYGTEGLDTPSLDRLATEGMRFTDAYAAAPVCSPTRAAMMTGQSPARLQLTNHAPGNIDGFSLDGSDLQAAAWIRNLPLKYVTIAERLSEAGYVTAHIGKWHLSYVNDRNAEITELELRPEKQGFDINIGGCSHGGPPSYFAPYRIPALTDGEDGEYLPERLGNEAIQFVRENRDRPFFLSWWPYSVHYPTLLEVAGLSPTPNHPLDGQSLLPLLKQSTGFERDFICFHYPNYAFHKRNRLGSAIREGDYKLIKRYDDGSLELYNLASDIGERKNLAKMSPEIASRLERNLNAWLQETDAQMPVRRPAN